MEKKVSKRHSSPLFLSAIVPWWKMNVAGMNNSCDNYGSRSDWRKGKKRLDSRLETRTRGEPVFCQSRKEKYQPSSMMITHTVGVRTSPLVVALFFVFFCRLTHVARCIPAKAYLFVSLHVCTSNVVGLECEFVLGRFRVWSGRNK